MLEIKGSEVSIDVDAIVIVDNLLGNGALIIDGTLLVPGNLSETNLDISSTGDEILNHILKVMNYHYQVN